MQMLDVKNKGDIYMRNTITRLLVILLPLSISGFIIAANAQQASWQSGEKTVKEKSITLLLKGKYKKGEDIPLQVKNSLDVDVYTFGCDGGCNDFEIFDVEGKRIFPPSCTILCNRDNTLIKSGKIMTIGVWDQRYKYQGEQVPPGTYEMRVNYIGSELHRRYINESDDGTEIDGVLVKRIEIE